MSFATAAGEIQLHIADAAVPCEAEMAALLPAGQAWAGVPTVTPDGGLTVANRAFAGTKATFALTATAAGTWFLTVLATSDGGVTRGLRVRVVVKAA